MKDFISKLRSGDKKYISKAISFIENNHYESEDLLKEIFKYTGKAYRIGITGPPGAGKSSLTDCLIKSLLIKNYKVGVIAVDPTSPFTGGALLGDRVRMSETGLLKDVYIRSMATRGSLGGLSRYVVEACNILDAAGKDIILIETVGVGQSELDIAQTADTTIVVLVPESGDSVQAMKAGLMEIADIFVLNKSDRAGADEVVSGIKNILHLKQLTEFQREIPVLKTIAIKNTGIDLLVDEIIKHKEFLEKNKLFDSKRIEHLKREITDIINSKLQKDFWDNRSKKVLDENLLRIYNKESDPFTFAEHIIKIFKK